MSSSLELHPGELNYILSLQRHTGQTAVLQALALGHMRSNDYSTTKIFVDNFLLSTLSIMSTNRCSPSAVCKFLTLLKHKNTVICLQIFKKHAKLTCLSDEQCYSQLFSFENVRSGRNVGCLFWFVKPAHCQFTQWISAPRVASWRETQRKTKHSSSCALVPVGVVNLATCLCVKSEEEGLVKKTSPIFWIWTAIPSSTATAILHTAPLNITN